MENKKSNPRKIFQSPLWRKKVKDSIELLEIYKDRKLTEIEKNAAKYLMEPIEFGSWREQSKNEVAQKIENPPAEIEHLKDSLKY